jgi:hypothetical protein
MHCDGAFLALFCTQAVQNTTQLLATFKLMQKLSAMLICGQIFE